jgi:putative transposase
MSEIIVQSVKFKYKPNPELNRVLADFKGMVNFCISKALEIKSTSLNKLHHAVYKELTSKYNYNTQYVISAIRVALAVLKSAKRKGVAPQIKKNFIRLSPLLTKFDGSAVRLSIKPRQFITILLEVKDYHERFIDKWKKGELKIGEIILNDTFIIIPFKKEVDLTGNANTIAFDVNEKSLVGLDDNGVKVDVDLSEMKRLHDTYFEKRRSIQSKLANKPNLMKRVLAKYKSREKNRVKDFLHKISRNVANITKGYTIIMENLTNIRKHIDLGNKLNRRLHSWNFRKLQFFIEYKAKLNGSRVIYVNPTNTSRACSRCGGIIRSTDRTCPKCGLDRHVNACINLLRKQDVGIQGYPESPLMKLLSGTGEVARLDKLISLSNLSTACKALYEIY